MTSYLHFCGGFGQTAGQPLRHWELTAIEAAHAAHPTATVLVHHESGSWANAPSYVHHVTWTEGEASQWSTWRASHGAHMSDRVRLLALLKYGGLYQDTDSFMLKPCPELLASAERGDWCGIPFQTRNRTICNGFIAASVKSSWLEAVYAEVDQLGAVGKYGKRLRSWDASSCKTYSRQYRKRLPNFDAISPELYTITTWHNCDKDMWFGPVTESSLDRLGRGKVVHAMSSDMPYKLKTSLMDEPPAGSLYSYVLQQLRET